MKPYFLNHNVYLKQQNLTSSIDVGMVAINGNSGNSVITQSIAHFIDMREGLHGVDNMWNVNSFAHENVDYINENFTHVIVNLQDQLQEKTANHPWAALTQFIQKIKLPFIVFSLGANAVNQTAHDVKKRLSSSCIRFYKTLSEKTVSLGIRGEFTASVLDHLHIKNYSIVGCPSYFFNGAGRIVTKNAYDDTRPVAATGLFSNQEINRLHFFLQDEQMFLRSFFMGAPSINDTVMIDAGYPGYDACSLHAFYNKKMFFSFSKKHWSNQLKNGNYLFAGGTRVHGAIMAINNDVPAFCTNADERAKEMCALFKIPHLSPLCGADFSCRQLYDMIDVAPMNAAYADLYHQFISWLKLNGLTGEYLSYDADDFWPIAQVPLLSDYDSAARMIKAIR